MTETNRRWILLRGLVRGRGHWGDFSERVQKAFPRDQFEFLDLPGNGERHLETSPFAIKDYVEDLRNRSELLKSGPVHLVGISLGGMIVTEWMRRHAEEIVKGFLICTSSAKHSPSHLRFFPQNILHFAPLFLSRDPHKYEEVVLSLNSNNQERRAEQLDRFVDYTRRFPVRRLNFFRQIFAASQYDFPEKAPGDVVLMGSHGDRLVSPTCTLDIASAWELKAEMHPWAGHEIPLDDPEWVVKNLLKNTSSFEGGLS